MSYNGKDIQVYHQANPVSNSNRFPVTASMSGGVLVTEEFDYISAAYPDTDTEVYTYKLGGSGGTTVAVVTINYTDATKEFISDVTKV